MSKKQKWYVAIIVFIVLVLSYLFLQWPYAISCSATNRFTIGEEFDIVRKTLVRTPAKYKILEANGATVVDQNWGNISLGFDRVIHPNWDIDAVGLIKLNVKNPYWGQRLMIVKQIINITPNSMTIHVVLLNPVKQLQFYTMDLKLSRSNNHTVVESKIVMGIEVKVPCVRLIHNRVNSKLKESVHQAIVANQNSMIQCIRKYKGKNYIDLTRKANKRD